ncbi:MAG: right-handed parallel beta-helix repeat-containing protein [Eubacterium sp.]|nr:right-handed parallel beta-helix repeat-containing protein [Eubacterium sp.]
MCNKRTWLSAVGMMLMAMVFCLGMGKTAEAKTYTIKTTSTPDKKTVKKLKKKKTYNKNTKQYYTIQYYLDKLAKKGGTLKLKKGTYKIPRTLNVPSNVNIKLNNGVKIVKTTKTGTKKLKSTKVLFQFVSTTNSKKSRKVTKYNGTKNSSITGSGTVTIDMGKNSGATAIYVGHAKNINIKNLKFVNKYGRSYLWIEGSTGVVVDKCVFRKGVARAGVTNQMDIRMEVTNKTINTYSGKWGKLDNTVNNNIKITNNQFNNSEIAVGSCSFVTSGSKVYYQTGITISNNHFLNNSMHAVYANAWSKPVITGNVMTQSNTAVRIPAYVKCLGVNSPTISSNTFSGCAYSIQIANSVNYTLGTSMVPVSSSITSANVTAMKTNTVANITYYYVTQDGSRLFYFDDKTQKNFTITPTTAPFHDKYTDYADYQKKKYYYVFTSYMQQLELTGGGTVTVEAGTYPITNNICIPSNVTLNLKNGVTFEKAGTTTKDICYAKALFVLVPPSKDGTVKTVSGYNGSQNVKIIGSGKVIMDCKNMLRAMSIILGHTQNVTISGITFQNLYGFHHIELNSSKNVTVKNCTFEGFKPYDQKSHKECINIDGTDENTGGFNYDWSAHDKTTCKDVYITNNTFKNVGTAVGSHTYSAENGQQKYHENVQIKGNIVDNTYNAAVRALNWKDSIIENNVFKNIQTLIDDAAEEDGKATKYVALLLRGVVNPTVKNNTFDTVNYYPIRVSLVTQPNVEGTVAAGYPATICADYDETWEDLWKNNTFKDIPEKYQKIVIRDDDNDKDSKSNKILLSDGTLELPSGVDPEPGEEEEEDETESKVE